jgi:hypothetical protein
LAGSSDYFGNNTSGLVYNGLGVTEVGVAYGREVPHAPGLYVGGNLKLLIGDALYYQQEVLQNTEFPPNFQNAASQYSLQPGVDLGVLWDADRTLTWMPMRPRVGVTARNITNPRFDQPSSVASAPACAPGEASSNNSCVLLAQPSRLSLGQQVRAGAALSPLHFWTITADVDLDDNPTLVSGYNSRMAGLGTEIDVFDKAWLNIPLRAGIERNFGEAGSPDVITAGFGLNFYRFSLDAAGELTPQTQTIQSQDKSTTIPSEFGFEVQLAYAFGGEKKN